MVGNYHDKIIDLIFFILTFIFYLCLKVRLVILEPYDVATSIPANAKKTRASVSEDDFIKLAIK